MVQIERIPPDSLNNPLMTEVSPSTSRKNIPAGGTIFPGLSPVSFLWMQAGVAITVISSNVVIKAVMGISVINVISRRIAVIGTR
jgi:hypothetical protein